MDLRDYSRLEATVFRREGLSKLSVLVVGAGALGNEVIKNLALLGTGSIAVVDRDHIETSNLTRSILFCGPAVEAECERKRPKAELVADRVKQINPDVEVEPFVGEIADYGLGRIQEADLVFSCLDNEMARLELSWACLRTGRILVDGGLGLMNYSSGLVSVFPGWQGPCYLCRKGVERRRQLLQEVYGREDPCWVKERNQEEIGAIPTTPLMSSVVAAIQVELGLRRVLSSSETSDRKTGVSYSITLIPSVRILEFEFTRSPSCPLHEEDSLIRETRKVPVEDFSQTTIGDLFTEVGKNATYLSLDWAFTLRASCSGCKHSWKPVTRRARFRSSVCPNCGSSDLVEVETVSQIHKDSQWTKLTLLELGFSKEHIFEFILGESANVARAHIMLQRGS